MKLRIVAIKSKRASAKNSAMAQLAEEYRSRLSHYVDVSSEEVRSEDGLIHLLESAKGRTTPVLISLDSAGKQLSSPELAQWIEQHQDAGTQQLLFAIGGADGLTAKVLTRSQFTLSFGRLTLPHELARIILLEQLYRAFTILKGHPYHSGHRS